MALVEKHHLPTVFLYALQSFSNVKILILMISIPLYVTVRTLSSIDGLNIKFLDLPLIVCLSYSIPFFSFFLSASFSCLISLSFSSSILPFFIFFPFYEFPPFSIILSLLILFSPFLDILFFPFLFCDILVTSLILPLVFLWYSPTFFHQWKRILLGGYRLLNKSLYWWDEYPMIPSS